MVEFALVAPVFLLVAVGLVVAGVVETNQAQITNAARDAARAAAVCGGPTRNLQPITPTLPDGRTACDSGRLVSWINQTLQAVPGGVVTGVCVYVGSSNGDTRGTTCVATDPVDSNILDKCNKGSVVQVAIDYPQQLYIPLLGTFLGDSGSQVRTLHAKAQAVCEQ